MPPPPSDPSRLGVATPERVSLELPVAGVGSRTGAWLLDAGLMFVFWLCVYFVFSLLGDVLRVFEGLSSFLLALVVLVVFSLQWIYWTAFEVLWNGQTPGKRWAGIRVVRLDGAPVGFFESAIRNLLRLVDFLPAFYALGVVTMLTNPQHRRLGDLAAGTVLVRDEQVNLDRYVGAASSAGPFATTLSGADAELVLSYLERAPTLAPEARARLGAALVQRLAADLPEDERARLVASPAEIERFLRERAHG
jgi:uncharacterized RDD family membrane protein YckC